MIHLSKNAITVLQKRDYLRRDRSGRIIETPLQMFKRVANAIAAASGTYGEDVAADAHAFYEMMTRFEFLPNSPTLMHAGRNGFRQLSACFVLPIEDSLESIFKTLHDAALVLRTGGGVGYSFSKLRPRGSRVETTNGVASGPVSFMDLFDHMAYVINEGSSRRVAMMGILRVDHPDIEEFILAKAGGKHLANFNISVGITDRFMEVVKHGSRYALVDPCGGKIVREVSARKIFRLICEQAWKVADPGLVFLDRMNAACPIRHLGEIEAVNVCGEQPLLPYQSCNLGSINLSKFVEQKKGKRGKVVDWKRLRQIIKLGVKFLDNVIDVCDYPVPEILEMSLKTRKIGLGVMGFADFLTGLGISYNSKRGLALAERLARFIESVAREESIALGKSRGSFPAFRGSGWEKDGYAAMRNSTVTTIAPTGTISILAACSSGIEPLFALSFTRRNILEIGRTEMVEFNLAFSRALARRVKEKKLRESILEKVAKTGSCQGVDGVPSDLARIFVTSHDISFRWHVAMQAAWQKHVDSAVSKTINLPQTSTVEDVYQAYLTAYESGCMGVTIYRDKSREQQVLNLGLALPSETRETALRESAVSDLGDGERKEEVGMFKQHFVVTNGDSSICPECRTPLMFHEGCTSCPNCSFSVCSVG